MADGVILTPGLCTREDVYNESVITEEYLIRDNYLSEYSSESEKAAVRTNLNIPSLDDTYTKDDIDIKLSESAKQIIRDLLNMDDPYGIMPLVMVLIKNMVKTDGSTPFTLPQSGKDPTADDHLATKRFVETLLKEHLKTTDPHKILDEVLTILYNYVKSDDVYTKNNTYSKKEVDSKIGDYVKRDGSTSFTAPQTGVDPTSQSHLSTKRYVDKIISAHKSEDDPHSFLKTLTSKLESYVKKSDVYDRTLTYSRTLINNIINKLVALSVADSIVEYTEQVNTKLTNIENANYVKSNGSVPFTQPQSGIDAESEDLLVTLRLVNELLSSKIASNVWIPSGPVESTVGFVEDDSVMPAKMTLQQVCDAIFYGLGLDIEVPDNVSKGDVADITVIVYGSTSLITKGELYQNCVLIKTVSGSDFDDDGKLNVLSNAIDSDTEIKFIVYYTNGTSSEVSKTIHCVLPSFVGLLPLFQLAATLDMDDLSHLIADDSVNNRFFSEADDIVSVTLTYSFQDANLRMPFIMVPATASTLKNMVTTSLSFGIEAFNVITLPILVGGSTETYKIYVYKQALSSLNLTVIFNFETV